MQLDNSFITDPNMGDIEFLSSGVDESYREHRPGETSNYDDSR